MHGALTFADVAFKYDDEHPVLNGLNLAIGARETVALVAASGGGKSTLASLLLRFREPQHGSILLDGIALRESRWPICGGSYASLSRSHSFSAARCARR